MTAARKTGGRAAKTEKNEEPRQVTWRGLSFVLPQELPASVAFDIEEMESSDGSLTTVLRFMRSLLGDDQTAQVRRKFVDDGDVMSQLAEGITPLIQDVLEAYGLTAGKSPASEKS